MAIQPVQLPSHADGNLGTCHICRGWLPVVWCNLCRHYFCEACRRSYFRRGLDAVKEAAAAVSGRLRRIDRPCCGPDAGERNKA